VAIAPAAKKKDHIVPGMPAWLRNEVARFTPAKWVKYWDRHTGRKKLERPKGPRQSSKKMKYTIPSGGNLLPLSNREVQNRVARRRKAAT
jgi:hypothetical protein